MQKETLDKLRRYIDLTATCFWPALEEELEEAWQEFVEADLAEERELREWLDMVQDDRAEVS